MPRQMTIVGVRFQRIPGGQGNLFLRRHGYVRGESAGLGYKSLDLGQEAKVYHVIPEVMSVVCAVGACDKGGGPFFV